MSNLPLWEAEAEVPACQSSLSYEHMMLAMTTLSGKSLLISETPLKDGIREEGLESVIKHVSADVCLCLQQDKQPICQGVQMLGQMLRLKP